MKIFNVWIDVKTTHLYEVDADTENGARVQAVKDYLYEEETRDLTPIVQGLPMVTRVEEVS